MLPGARRRALVLAAARRLSNLGTGADLDAADSASSNSMSNDKIDEAVDGVSEVGRVMSGPKGLSPLESAYLHLESARTPMHIGCVLIFEGPALRDDSGQLRLDEIRDRIERRLHFVPKLRRCVHRATLPGAPAVWVDDPHFEIGFHVEVVRLAPPGTKQQFLDLCGEVFGRPLDRTRPLWHLCVVDGLSEDRIAVVGRLHHALVDGLAGLEIASVVLDVQPQPADAASGAEPTEPWHPEALPCVASRAIQDFSRLNEPGWRLAGLGWQAMRHPLGALRDALRVGGAFTVLAGTGVVRPFTSLNRPIGANRAVLIAHRRLGEVHAAAHALGVTVNDIVLTAVGGGVARLLQERGEDPPVDIQVLVPVALSNGTRGELGNEFSVWLVRVPVGTTEPLARLHAVSESTRRARNQHEELATETLLDLMAPVPQPIVALLGTLANHQPLFNVIVTNVPGPPVPLYMMGARLTEIYPFVPLGGNLTIGLAAMSYDGELSFGILFDPATCPDASVFADGVEEDLALLSAVALD